MNPIRALLWKEGREAAYKIAAGAGLALVAGLICAQQEFPHGTEIQIVSHLVGLFGAVLMGMDVIARERSRMTLPFLLSRPLEPWKMLVVKFAVGAIGLLVVLAAYWGGVFIEIATSGSRILRTGQIRYADFAIRTLLGRDDILSDVGYVRVVSLWFLVYLIPYGVAVLASVLADHPLKAAMNSLMTVWVAWVLFMVVWTLAPQIARFYFRLVFHLKIMTDAGILRQAFDTSLLLVRAGATALLAGGALLCACRVFRAQASNRFQWAVGGLALICAFVVVIGRVGARSPHRYIPVTPVAPVGSLPYKMNVADLALSDGLAVVLLERGLSVVDVTDPMAPAEIGRVERDGWRLKRLALSGSRAYVWGEIEDSVGVAVFNLSPPERPHLQALSPLYPVEKGPRPWLPRIPRLVGWAVWKGHLYAGLLRNEFLELHSFDVREKGLPPHVYVFPIEETKKHAWNNKWAMRIVGPHAFLALGHDFVVLDLADPARPEVLSRTPLRRFGRSVHYEKMVKEFHRKLSSGRPEERWMRLESERLNIYVDSALPGLGPFTVGDDRAYIERHLPREIAVVDISDPRRPVEVDYIPWTHLPRRLTIAGESAYALNRGMIQTYVKTGYDTFSPQEKLGFADYEEHLRNVDILDDGTLVNSLARDMYIPAGGHIYALLNNKLAIFETPKRAE